MNINKLAVDVVYNAAAVFGSDLLGLTSLINPSDSQMVKYAKSGLILSAVDEVLNYVRYGNTWLLNGETHLSIDNALYNTLGWGLLESLGVVQRVWTLTDNLLLPPNLQNATGQAIVKVSMKTLQDIIDAYGMDSQLSYGTHLYSKLMLRN